MDDDHASPICVDDDVGFVLGILTAGETKLVTPLTESGSVKTTLEELTGLVAREG